MAAKICKSQMLGFTADSWLSFPLNINDKKKLQPIPNIQLHQSENNRKEVAR